ncbi:hypothetical protein H5410_008544 [Solanum commersonii]|uniref:Uncharacterized protein n=1 Tax=Solanum commersonii TaxID=4109 RepID=A0A9J6AF79_SOLCO|nr:hypothetical protein H5410_008544 [Solanum commersonii]
MKSQESQNICADLIINLILKVLLFQPPFGLIDTIIFYFWHSSSDNGNESQPVTPPNTVEIRIRRRPSKRQRQKEEEIINAGKQAVKPKPPPKDWESMNLTEKAIELYVGEKGLLFWLNKFAYASIFIIIGGWILFRFVGPAFDLYQLDTPTPLAPESMFKGTGDKP